MGLLQTLKYYFFNKSLKAEQNKLSKVPRQMVNLDLAETIGILFNATQAKDVMEVSQYALKLQEMGKRVAILGFQNTQDKELNDSRFFNNTNVNWIGIPASDRIEKFMNTPFDLLLTALTEECLPIEYISACSKAKFRVGTFNQNKTHYFDLMVDTNKNNSLTYLLNQIHHFIKAIKP